MTHKSRFHRLEISLYCFSIYPSSQFPAVKLWCVCSERGHWTVALLLEALMCLGSLPKKKTKQPCFTTRRRAFIRCFNKYSGDEQGRHLTPFVLAACLFNYGCPGGSGWVVKQANRHLSNYWNKMNTILSSVIIAGMPPGKNQTRGPLSADVKVHAVRVEVNSLKSLLSCLPVIEFWFSFSLCFLSWKN